MFTGIVSNWTSVVGTNVPFTTVINSNCKTANNDGTIMIRKPGYYDVDVNLTMYGVAGEIIVNLYADGVATKTFAEVSTSSATDIVNVSLTDAIHCVLAKYPNVGNISVQIDTAGLTVSGNIRVQYVS